MLLMIPSDRCNATDCLEGIQKALRYNPPPPAELTVRVTRQERYYKSMPQDFVYQEFPELERLPRRSHILDLDNAEMKRQPPPLRANNYQDMVSAERQPARARSKRAVEPPAASHRERRVSGSSSTMSSHPSASSSNDRNLRKRPRLRSPNIEGSRDPQFAPRASTDREAMLDERRSRSPSDEYPRPSREDNDDPIARSYVRERPRQSTAHCGDE